MDSSSAGTAATALLELAGTVGDMATDLALRHQLQRARHLLATQQAEPADAADAAVPSLPSGVERARHRSLQRRLPDPVGDTVTAVGKLVAGRVKLPQQMRTSLGWGPRTELVIATHGTQLLIAERAAATELVGAPARLDATGRLMLTDGQRQLLGVGHDGSVLLSAEVATGVLRVVDPARIHALLAEITPLDGEEQHVDPTDGQTLSGYLKLAAVNGDLT